MVADRAGKTTGAGSPFHSSHKSFDTYSQAIRTVSAERFSEDDPSHGLRGIRRYIRVCNAMGKHVVITGGEGDLAMRIGCVFRDAGYEVTLPGRDILDVCDPDSIRNFFLDHPCDLLVCCAGVTKDALLSRTGGSDWDLVWQTNYQGAKRCAEAALPAMIDKAEGHIVFISSHSALHPPEGQVAYSAAKRALIGLGRDLAVRHGKSNIRVHVVLPGFLDNRMTSEVSATRKGAVMADHALGRLNTMDCVAGFTRFLHESMPHTSGQWFQLDSRESTL